ncbi:MAG: glycerol-3-phosphate dehydrogenase [Solirubrobacteraceae bacterium]|nr:glycerol-3-phosphate dehydrogenase [Solirubrobacteraceae bacterium]
MNPLVYWAVRAAFQPAFRYGLSMTRLHRERIPAVGPVILASNHRSFLDPFLIACLVRRPVYFVAKRELFGIAPIAWILGALGAFPIERGRSDDEAMATARLILQRGDCVVIFPEGTRVRPGPLGTPRRGVGRLALQTGAPVVPVAVMGTEDVRRGIVFRPRRVALSCGAPLRFPTAADPSPQLAKAVTDRIWPHVERQWVALGGEPGLRETPMAGDENAPSGVEAA